ncbi:hypothetical protein ULMS_08580 [Patiriisocius marinistellae]|uniref:Uncharacterized protein n=1 Tax=Patiriisocius marinistellae TaxID=2494560 RepID=A0A5J4FU55_9FLAO|nr:hypothetical protein [Patiriisocius marinistellae]GEQ85350.1 hypothetical protein ULMS_08580 [Patiriisocius marinistellae]
MLNLKLTISIILFTAFNMVAQMDVNDDRLYLKDGTVLIGDVKMNSNRTTIFENPEGEPKKFKNDKIDKVVFYKNGKRNTFKSIYFKKSGKYQYLKLELVGNLTLYSKYIIYGPSGIPNAQHSGDTIYYYVRPNETELKKLKLDGFARMGINRKKSMKFFRDCPLLVSKIKNKEIEDITIKKMVHFYNNNCE